MKLSHLIDSAGNDGERKQVLTQALELWRERGDVHRVARTLMHLSDANRILCLYEEGEQQAKEALHIFTQHNDTSRQAKTLCYLAWLWCDEQQFDAAEEAALRVIDLLSDTGDQFRVCECHRVLGEIYYAKDRTDKAINHFETALGIASSFDWQGQLFWIHHSLARQFSKQGRFDDAHARIGRAKSHAINDPYYLGRAMYLEACVWYWEHRLEDAKSEVLRAVDVFEKFGAPPDRERCGALLRAIEKMMADELTTSGDSDFDDESMEMVPLLTSVNPPSSVR